MREIRPWLVWGPPAVVLLFALMIAAGSIALIFRAPPIAYSSGEYVPERSIVKPGETLVYTPTLTLRQGGYIRIVRSYWDIDRNQSAVTCDGTIAPSVIAERSIPPTAAGVVRGNTVKLTVPNLPPGHYELVSSATGANGGESWYLVRFSVVTACGR